ncbi:MAG: ABC transporter ATP-binding protein [Dehalococcoidia bacterium]|nr:ABC transporter ATP-binding protein [Dehalococcoidia bacterium]
MAYITLQQVTKVYPGPEGGVSALTDVSLEIQQGDFAAILGPSGSGKSTLLTVLGAMSPPSRGRVEIDGRDLYREPSESLADFRRRRIGFVFQQQHLIPYLTAVENVMLPLAVGRSERQLERAMNALKEVGLDHRASHLPGQLSGGEQGRVAIARAIVNDPLLILADEPTGNLDAVSRESVLALLSSLNKEGRTIVMVTHSREAADAANRTIVLRDGRVVS